MYGQSVYDVVMNKTYHDSISIEPFTYLCEDFENNCYPPRYWTYINQYYWRRAEVSSYGKGSLSLKFAFNDAPIGRTESLVSPVIDLSSNEKVLKFDFAHCPNYPMDDKLKIEVSSDGGSTFDTLRILHGYPGGELNTVLWGNGNFVPDSSQWQTKTFILPGNTNRIRFTAISEHGDNLYLDNIQIGEAPYKDVGILTIDIDKFILPGEFIPKYTVKNYGRDTVSFNVKIKIANYESQSTVNNLPPNTKRQIFGDPFIISAGDNIAKVSTYLENDQNTGNDTLSYYFFVINSEWQQGDTLLFPCGMGSCSAIVKDDTGYVIISGGDVYNHNPSNLAAIYNVNTNKWNYLPVMPETKVAFATGITSTSYYAIGGGKGNYDTTTSSKVYALDLKSREWSQVADMPLGLVLHKAVSYEDSLIYVIGGHHHYVDNHRIFLYNTNENKWRELDSFQLPSLAGALTIFKNKIIYIGGAGDNAVKSTTYIGDIQPNHSIIWHQGADYPLGTRFRWNAAPWGEKGVIVMNGCRTAYWIAENECYLYNPDNDTWHIMPPKNFNTCGTQIASLQIGGRMKLFALGGFISDEPTNYNEILADSITVPVELTSFTSTISKNSVTLKWSTATEKNNYGFEIERKDLKSEFKRIGFIKGKGTTTELSNYSYSDNNLAPNAYNYRIKQIDYDGNCKYYYLANEVNLQYMLTYSLEQNYPNPFNPSTTIKYAIAKTGVVTLKLYDILGKEKAVLVNERKEPGNYVYEFKNLNLSSGVYFYTLKVNDYGQTKKMVILK